LAERWPVDVASGSSEVVASGSVISFKGDPVTVTFGPPDDRLQLSFEFKDNPGAKDLRVEQLVEGSHMRLLLTNFNDPLGSGSSHPIQLGAIRERALFLNFRVYSLREADRTVVYTLYLANTLASRLTDLAKQGHFADRSS
jgi:hypothetical protein